MNRSGLVLLTILGACAAQDASDDDTQVIEPGGGGKGDSTAPVVKNLMISPDHPDKIEVACNEWYSCDMFMELRMTDSRDTDGVPLGPGQPLDLNFTKIDPDDGFETPWITDYLRPATTQDYHLQSYLRKQRYRLDISAGPYDIAWATVQVTAHWN